MPRGVDLNDQARLARRLLVPNGVGGIGKISDAYGLYYNGAAEVRESTYGQVGGRIVTYGRLDYPASVAKIEGLTAGADYTVSARFVGGSDTKGYVRIGVLADGGGAGAPYDSGPLSFGTAGGTFTAPAGGIVYFSLHYNDVAGGVAEYDNLSLRLTSASLRDRQIAEGYLNWVFGGWSGLAASHPFRNRAPLIGD